MRLIKYKKSRVGYISKDFYYTEHYVFLFRFYESDFYKCKRHPNLYNWLNFNLDDMSYRIVDLYTEFEVHIFNKKDALKVRLAFE